MSQLDKLAHGVAQARTTGQFDHLKAQEDAFVEHLLDLAPELDQRAVGAAWLILGQLIATGMSQHPEHLQLQAVGNLLNAARFAGQKLYSGAELVHPCPIPRSNGTACRFTAKGARQEVLDAMMRAHVEVYHPGRTWPAQPSLDWKLSGDASHFDAQVAGNVAAVAEFVNAARGEAGGQEDPRPACVKCSEHPGSVALPEGLVCLLCWRELYPDANPEVDIVVNAQGELEAVERTPDGT